MVLLDIRPEDEFEDWHIPTSENIPIYDLLREDAQAARTELKGLPQDREIVTVCAMGIRSQTATDLLQEMDYHARTLEEGMLGWSRVHESETIDIEVDGTLLQIARPGKGCLSYILISDGEAAVFDPSQFTDEYVDILNEYDVEPIGVFDTHGHADHLSGGASLADRLDVPYHLHPSDAIDIDASPVRDESTFGIGQVVVTMLHTPGHSPGSVTYDLEGRALLTGDTLFHGSVGRVELGVTAGIEETDVEMNAETLYQSLQRLRSYDHSTLILPAHDPGTPWPPVTATLEEVENRNADLRRPRASFVENVSSGASVPPSNFQRIKGINIGLNEVDRAERTTLEIGPNRCAVE